MCSSPKMEDGVKTGTKPKKERFCVMKIVLIYEGGVRQPTIRVSHDVLSYCQMT
jgi:hypothetical protein